MPIFAHFIMDTGMNCQEQTKRNKVSQLLLAESEMIGLIHNQYIAGWPELDEAIALIEQTAGRVILSGMGKSGHVAVKVTATMASLGKPAHFVHPAEASHGDLGMLARGDTLLAFSNSGNTQEMFPILNYAKEIGVPIIGITMGAESTLAKASTVPLVIPKMKEGCSLGLAPTTSTTAQIAIGDALAVGVAVLMDFTRDNFNKLHPGGSLGHSTSKVGDCMSCGEDVPLVEKGASSSDLIWTMARKRSDIAGVLGPSGDLIGLVYASDLSPNQDATTEGIMRTVSPVVGKDDSVATAISRMNKMAVKSCFVVEDGKPVGMMRA